MYVPRVLPVVLAAVVMTWSSGFVTAEKIGEVCDSTIYCNGTILHVIQMARLYKDSKTFVDKPLKNHPTVIEAAFDKLMNETNENPTKDQIQTFVDANFDAEGTEFVFWDPSDTDWKPNPAFFDKIPDPNMKTWAKELHAFWAKLGKQLNQTVIENPEFYSIIPVTHPVIVPGGRFREFFYWDSYWIQIGLLYSEMYQTVEGMLQNFLDMVDMYGFVPNGGRIYFTRSQPPLLIPMVKNFVVAMETRGNDTDAYLLRILPTLDAEFHWWISERRVEVTKAGKTYNMFRYNSEQNLPRPESYREDYELAHHLNENEKMQLYHDLHSGAESGWDFSSRWWMPEDGQQGNLTYTRTTGIIPADLNGYMYLNAILMAEFYNQVGLKAKKEQYQQYATEFAAAIDGVLWDEAEGVWFDYEIANDKLRKEFYVSNIVPLWAGLHQKDPNIVMKVVNYLRKSGSLKYVGGVPTSMLQTGEQWDFPNGWAPLQHIVVDALDRTDVAEAKAVALEIANKWVSSNYQTYEKSNSTMFEKYDVTSPGQQGGGGEYEIVVGFGWTNGVILDFLTRYGDDIKPTNPNNAGLQLSPFTSTTLTIGSVSVLMASVWG